jgi:DNA-binding NtrC family response regulator
MSNDIFILDDDEMMRKIIGNILANDMYTDHYKLHFFADYKDMLKEVSADIPTILLIDYDLQQELTGLEVIEEFRRTNRKALILAISSEESYDISANMCLMGANNFILKKDIRHLPTVIEAHLTVEDDEYTKYFSERLESI